MLKEYGRIATERPLKEPSLTIDLTLTPRIPSLAANHDCGPKTFRPISVREVGVFSTAVIQILFERLLPADVSGYHLAPDARCESPNHGCLPTSLECPSANS